MNHFFIYGIYWSLTIKLEEQQKSLQVKIAKVKDKQLQKIGKLADKHHLATWDEKVLDKAFTFIQESGQEQFKNNDKEIIWKYQRN